MTATENIRDIFAILHDGIICDWSGDKNLLTLKVDCQYLAKRIDKSFNFFYIDIILVNKLQLKTWPNPFDLPVITLTEIHDIFKAKLEILSTEIHENFVVVDCNQHDTAFSYCGGNMTIGCEKITIYDQNKNELTIDELDNICKEYWAEMSKIIENEIIDKQNKN